MHSNDVEIGENDNHESATKSEGRHGGSGLLPFALTGLITCSLGTGGCGQEELVQDVSPSEVLARIRNWRAKGNTEKVSVTVRGTLRITEPIVLTPDDRDIVFSGEDDATISGGFVLEGWRDAGNGVWEADLPKGADGKAVFFEQLFVNGRRADAARLPKGKGYFRSGGLPPIKADSTEFPEGWKPGTSDGGEGWFHFNSLTDHAYAYFAALDEADLGFVRVVRHVRWDIDSHVALYRNDKTKVIGTAGGELKSYNMYLNGDPIHFENLRTAFDSPGEWYYDGVNGKVLYRPLEGETLEGFEAIAPVDGLESLIVFKGDPENGRFAGGVVFENITFEHTDSKPYAGPARISSYQSAATTCCATILADYSRGVELRNCRVRRNGSYAVWFREGCMSNSVVNCEFTELGAGGLKIGTFRKQPIEPRGAVEVRDFVPASTAFIKVDNCLIAHGGRIHMAGCGVLIGHASDCEISHNEIFDIYYTGVSVGWVWGYAGSVCQRNLIAFNHIHHIGQNQLADMGGVYTLGTSFGTVVRNNLIHNIDSYSYGGWGLYNDEGSEEVVMEKNLVYDTNCESYHQHYGRNNHIRNNILAFARLPSVRVTRKEPHRSVNFEGNIVLCENGAIGGGTVETDTSWKKNLWWCPPGRPQFDFAAWKKSGNDIDGAFADPLFADPAKRDFSLAPDSPAYALGFEAFDPSEAGRR